MITVLLFLIFLAPTIEYRMRVGPVSFSLMEPVVLVASIFLFFREYVKKHSISWPRHKIFLILLVLLYWAIFAQVIFSDSTQTGLSDIRNWFVPILGFVALLSIKRGWEKVIGVYIFTVFLNSLLGIYQYLTNSFRPFQITFGDSRLGISILNGEISLTYNNFALGLFTHPNDYGAYLVGGLMIALGFALTTRKFKDQIIIIPIVAALLFTFSKTSIVISVVLLLGFGVIWLRMRYPVLNWIYLPFVIFLLIGAIFVVGYLPSAIFATYYWRVGLWEAAYEFFLQNPVFLLIGGGFIEYGKIAYYIQPHDLYIYMLLQYGLPGLVILLSILWETIMETVLCFQTNSVNKMMLAGLFLAVLTTFAIGFTESTLFGIEPRMIFITWLALCIGFTREKRLEMKHRKAK